MQEQQNPEKVQSQNKWKLSIVTDLTWGKVQVFLYTMTCNIVSTFKCINMSSWRIMNNSFNFLLIIFSERLEKISDIRRNIQQSIVVLLSAMDRMKIPLHNKANELSRDFIMKEAGNPESHRRNVSITVQCILVVLPILKTFKILFWRLYWQCMFYTGISWPCRTIMEWCWGAGMLWQIPWIPTHWLCEIVSKTTQISMTSNMLWIRTIFNHIYRKN